MDICTFDTTSLPHPEPLEIMTKALKDADDDKILVMIHHREPFPLYDIIRARSLAYHTIALDSHTYKIIIAKPKILDIFLAESGI